MYVIARVRLARDSTTVKTKSGKPMVTNFGFADVAAERGLSVGLTAFGGLAGELLKYRKADNVRVCGDLKQTSYTNRDGEDVTGYDIVLDAIAGVKSARGKYADPRPSKAAINASNDFIDGDKHGNAELQF